MEPNPTDAVRGGNAPSDRAVLGGLEGARQLIESGEGELQLKGLQQAATYPEGRGIISKFYGIGRVPSGRRSHRLTFAVDLLKAGYEVTRYSGRFYYEGVAVNAQDLKQVQAIIRATTVDVVYDESGLGFIVYPASYDIFSLYDALDDLDSLQFGLKVARSSPNAYIRQLGENLLDNLRQHQLIRV